MKKLILLLIVGGLAFAGYKYVNWSALTGGGGSLIKSGDQYPITRTITSSDGRKLDVVILGKEGDSIFVQVISNGKEYKLPSSRLSPDDAKYVASLPEGGNDSGPKAPADIEWHAKLGDAMASAQQSQTPIYMLFDGSGW